MPVQPVSVQVSTATVSQALLSKEGHEQAQALGEPTQHVGVTGPSRFLGLEEKPGELRPAPSFPSAEPSSSPFGLCEACLHWAGRARTKHLVTVTLGLYQFLEPSVVVRPLSLLGASSPHSPWPLLWLGSCGIQVSEYTVVSVCLLPRSRSAEHCPQHQDSACGSLALRKSVDRMDQGLRSSIL
ncbi:hypothetical protein CB1_000465070 [Camelus ferus]|nr:hypothetical protein CB1_000465070 [Camelus ferus]